MTLSIEDLRAAHRRIAGRIHNTPLLESRWLNERLGHRVVFKAENLQKIGAFKARGALNTLLAMKERNALPSRVVTYSSGNHAQAVAWSCAALGVPATVLMPEGASLIKRQATAGYGARVVVTKDRPAAHREGDRLQAEGAFLLPPFDHDDVICGQGTACIEALEDGPAPDAIFAPCGGGGLLSGTTLAARALAPEARVFGVEPVTANDAARSVRDGRLHAYEVEPDTIADGVRTLSLSERTFRYVRTCDGIHEVRDDDAVYWTQWLTHLLKATIEPTAALGMAAAAHWLRDEPRGRTVLVILSGGNLSIRTRSQVWTRDRLDDLPG